MEFATQSTNLFIKNAPNISFQNITSNDYIKSTIMSKLVDLDEDSKAQLSLKFIRSNMKSKWTTINKELELAYRSNDLEKINQLAYQYVVQLKVDDELWKNNQKISECGIFAIRVNSTYNRSDRDIRFANQVAEAMFCSGVATSSTKLDNS